MPETPHSTSAVPQKQVQLLRATTTGEENVIFKSFSFKVRSVEVTMPDGSKKDFHVLDQIPATRVIIAERDPDGTIYVNLVNQRRPKADDKTFIELPGGAIGKEKKGETPEENAKKEVREEQGVIASDVTQMRPATYSDVGLGNGKMYFFVASGTITRTKQDLEPEEDMKPMRMKLDDALTLVKNGGIDDVPTGYALMFYALFMMKRGEGASQPAVVQSIPASQ